MATRAERFRYDEQRSHQPKPAPRPSRKPKRRDTDDLGERNRSRHGGRKAAVATEENHSKRASRKSTRPSSNRGKNSVGLERALRMKMAAPYARHAAGRG